MSLLREKVRRAEWSAFMERFSRLHRGWRVRLGIIDTGLLVRSTESGAREVSSDALFEGIRLDRRVDGDQIAVLLGLPAELATHSVRKPRRLYVEREQSGADEALRIDAADGTSLLLQFPVAARPDQLDGLAPAEMSDGPSP